MRLTCTSCGKVYVVDEGLRGRAFRMRCKRCDAVIAVTAAEAPSAPAPGPQAPEVVGGAEAPGPVDDFADFSRELQDFAEELERESAPPPPPRPVAPVSEAPPVLRASEPPAAPGKGRSPRMLVAGLVAISAIGALGWHLARPSRPGAPAPAPVALVAATPTATPGAPPPAAAAAPTAPAPAAPASTALAEAAPVPTAPPTAAAAPAAVPKAERKAGATGKPARVASAAPSTSASTPPPAAPAAPGRAEPAVPLAAPRADLPPRDPQEAQAALAARAGSFDACVADALRDEPALLATPRPVVLTVTVRPNGRTAYPTLDDAQLTGTALGACLKRQAAAFVFPESGGEALRVRTSLVLGR